MVRKSVIFTNNRCEGQSLLHAFLNLFHSAPLAKILRVGLQCT